MALASYNKISNAIAGRPFGDFSAGDLTVSGNTTQTQTRRSCSGSSGSTTLTIGSAGFSNGDVILIHKTRGGANVGVFEFNKIASGGGSTSLTLTVALAATYTDSGAEQCQAVQVPLYNDVVVNSGITYSAPDWDGDTGGIGVLAANTLTVTGTIACNGAAGTSTGGEATGASGGGFRGGNGRQGQNSGMYGEGSAADRNYSADGSANGNGGGGGKASGSSNNGGGGGGGGNRQAGGTSSCAGSGCAYYGAGGAAVGNTDLTVITFGGGGGGGGNGATEGTGAGSGGSGGGMWVLCAKTITVNNTTGAINLNAGCGGNGWRGGGGGAGGSVLIQSADATLNTARVSCLWGRGGSGGGGSCGNPTATESGNAGADSAGGNGSNGRVTVHYSGSVSGTVTNGLYTTVLDATLVEVFATGGEANYSFFM